MPRVEDRADATRDVIARLALEVRRQLRPRLGILESVPLEVLMRPTAIEGVAGTFLVHARCHTLLPRTTYGMTTVDVGADRATIWLNREAWPELAKGVPRTRFTVAHELGHIALHALELDELEVKAEPDHDARLEAEANRFAAHLLIPDQALHKLAGAGPEALARRFGVSVPAAQRRIEEGLGGTA